MQFASRETLIDLTERRQKARVAAELTRMGLRYTLGPSGWPKVPVAALERMYGVEGRTKKTYSADVDALVALGLG